MVISSKSSTPHRLRTQFETAVLNFQRLDLFDAMRGQAVLQIDAGKRRWKLAQIGR